MQKITPSLWFDNQAEEAVNFYTGIFAHSTILDISRYGEAGPGPAGAVMTVSFRIEGQNFVALNGGPLYHFTPAISFDGVMQAPGGYRRRFPSRRLAGAPRRRGYEEKKGGAA